MNTPEALRQRVEEELPRQLDALGAIPEPLREAMRYSLLAGGKRLRPTLLLAAAEAVGGSIETALPFACALEMIHTYSLIHDDLPAMDNDDLRRGRPTNHKVFGEGMAILAGDALLHGAMELMLRTACQMPDFRGIRAAEAIARRCGVTGMVAGQVLDVTSESKQPTPESVRYIHLHKTADLITAAVEAGFLLGGASDAELQAGIAFGQHLGLSFQMMDDWLDVIGDTAVLGKTIGKDAAAGKQTWVALYGTEQTHADACAEIRLAQEALSPLGARAAVLLEIAQATTDRLN